MPRRTRKSSSYDAFGSFRVNFHRRDNLTRIYLRRLTTTYVHKGDCKFSGCNGKRGTCGARGGKARGGGNFSGKCKLRGRFW